MLNLRPFQIALYGFFGFAILAAFIFIVAFEGSLGGDTNPYGSRVTIWGTLDRGSVLRVLNELRQTDENSNVIEYVEKDPRTFDSELLNAIAEGRSPDLIIMPHESLVTHRAKLQPISYEAFPERTFRDRYIDGAEIFMFPEGLYGIPVAVDPLVMYWNRDLFSGSGLAAPPTTWEALVSIANPAITQKTDAGDILQSSIAFGEYTNVSNAKAVVAMLLLQAGTEIATVSSDGYQVTMANRSLEGGLPPGEAALSFYTQFALPGNANYTWSRSFPSDRTRFLGGNLALYVGFGSEYQALQNENPNLNFDLTRIPQGRNATAQRNFGVFYAFAIPKASDNIVGAYQAALTLTSANIARVLSEDSALAPVHRGVIAEGTGNPYRSVLYASALTARGWLDPSPAESENVFRQMIEDITSGRVRTAGEAVTDAAQRLRLLY